MMGDDYKKNARWTIRLCSALLPVSCGGESEARRKPGLAEAEFLAHGSNIDYRYPFDAHMVTRTGTSSPLAHAIACFTLRMSLRPVALCFSVGRSRAGFGI
jgi:hypothetical protein